MTITSLIASADELQVERFGVYVRVTDLDRSRLFYTSVLGKQPYVMNDRFVGFDLSGALFALYLDKDEHLTRSSNVVPYIRVQDAHKEYSRLQRLNTRLLDEQVVLEGPIKLFRFTDPDGNLLEIFSLSR